LSLIILYNILKDGMPFYLYYYTDKMGCSCNLKGGYRATKRNRAFLNLWKKGKSIGFTMRSSLKAKGLIPRASGKYIVSDKYKRRSTRKNRK
jgi:hypothetical protein